MTSTNYQVTGMSCMSCERHVKEEVAQIAGVTDVAVDHRTGHLTVTTDGVAPQDADILEAVEEAGYSAERVA